MSADLVVRKAGPSDLAFLRLAFRESLRACPHQMVCTESHTADAYFEEHIHQGMYLGDPLLVAESEGAVVGAILVTRTRGNFQFKEPGAAEHALYVRPECRRKGISSLLRQAAYQQLQSQGVAWVEGIIDKDNRQSLEAAAKEGFETVALVVRKRIAP